MVQLEVKSTDNLGYEWENISFIFNDSTLFRLTNHKLNRGGKGLSLINSKSETVLSCGRWSGGFHKKVVKYLTQNGFQITEKEIEVAVELRASQNKEFYNSKLYKEIKTCEKEIKIKKEEVVKLTSRVSEIKKRII